MADEKKDQVLYRPDLEPERHYLSDDIFQKSKVPNVPIPEEDTPDIEETTEEEKLKKARGIKQNATSTSTSVSASNSVSVPMPVVISIPTSFFVFVSLPISDIIALFHFLVH